MFSVAFYGKGGIGKSTVSSNVSFVLSSKGKVLHIGCDPKHDSTRLLLPTGRQATVLEKVVDGRKPSDLGEIVVEGKGGVLCVESGGPEPGVGCAGRGIITTFDILENLGIGSLQPDFKVFDVLGDVVCGGFAVPMRSDRSDGIVLVTSGEYMSVFAANNILKGIRRLDGETPRVLGIVQNSRGVENEDTIVGNFADSVGLPVIARIPRTRIITECEKANEPVEAMFPGSEPSIEICRIADAVVKAGNGEELHIARPLDDDQMECILKNRRPMPGSVTDVPCGKGCELRKGDVLETCSAAGAVDIGYFVDGLDILLHSPDSCAYIFSSFHDRMSSNDASRRCLGFVPSGTKMHCTGITDSDSIFGGDRRLRSKLEQMVSSGSKDIMVITTCMAGIIGDDVDKIVKEVENSHEGVRITSVRCDGNMTGHMGEGLWMATKAMFRYIDPDVRPDPGYVNILAMSFMKLSYKDKTKALDDLFGLFGLKINCRFIGGCGLEEIVNLKKGSLNVVVTDVAMAREMAEELKTCCGMEYLSAPAPIGLEKTCSWITALGEKLDRNDVATEAVEKVRDGYGRLVERLMPILKGVRVAILCDTPKNISWATEFMEDLGMDIVYIGFGPLTGKRKRVHDVGRCTAPIRTDYRTEDAIRDFPTDRPELMISRSEAVRSLDCHHMELTDGFMGLPGLEELGRRLEDSMRMGRMEGWRMM
ncbi:MAG: hypothetical protein MJZ68_00905 [archaeon]|nr:hypothetical protein [archaeon]